MREFDIIKYCVEHDMSVNYGKLSICDLSLSSGYKGNRKYQVYMETKQRFAENYTNLGDAVTKFIELKQQMRPNVY